MFAAASALAVTAALFSTAAAQDTVTLQVWTGASSDAENIAKEEQIAAFEEAFPNIDVELLISPDYGTQIQAAFAAGDYPDVFTVGQFDFPSFLDSGLLLSGEGVIEAQDDIYPNLLAAFTGPDGQPYCVPKDFSTLGLLYNMDLFDAAGVEYPTAEWTWDDMLAAARTITAETDAVGFSAAADRNRWLAFFYGNGATLFGEDGMSGLSSDAAVEALEFYQALGAEDAGALPSELEGSGWNGEAFGRGLAAMTIEGNWAIGYLQNDFPETNWGVAELPLSPAGTRGTLTFTECWAVGANTEHPEEAWQLVNFLTGVDGAMTVATSGFGVMPARPSASEAWLETRGEEYAAFVNGAEYAVAPVLPLGFGDLTTFIDELSVEVAEGGDVRELLTEAAGIADEITAENS
jgi:multiple sugar transport system substrate-binding protein